ncbi:MAG: PQQ-binding-like beta-propeller repeat protein [Phycisphaerae bacterium]|jgi:outer membrane protein assembly factor BamB|nr:PQQ-binding-like beta-propeller repeat protein [Phycisphaerae bacterium]
MSKRSVAGVTIVLLILTAMSARAGAENWPQWRGPTFNGATTEKNLPATFSTTENVLWKVDLPGIGGASPIVWEDKVFIIAQDTKAKKTYALCLNRKDGKELWRHHIGGAYTNRQGNSAASGSPITDGKTVWFLAGTGEMVAYDMDGKELWKRSITDDHGKFEILWKYGASPMLYKGRLYLAVLHGEFKKKTDAKCYVLCIDAKTGKDIWKHIRYTEAQAESKQAYTTPYPFEGPDGLRIIIVGGDRTTAHDPKDGKETWRSMNYNFQGNKWYRIVPSAVACKGVIFTGAPKGGPMFGIKSGKKGKLTKADNAWLDKNDSPDVCTPAVHNGRFYVLDGRKKKFVCKDALTGKNIWRGSMDTKKVLQASPTIADGKIYCMSLGGEVVVLELGDEFKVLHRTNMGGKDSKSTIVAAQGALFVRVDAKLYCIVRK